MDCHTPRRRYNPYCLPLEYSFENLSCLICNETLSSLDALRCRKKRIERVKRNGKGYGVCSLCLEIALQIERTLYKTELLDPVPNLLELKSGRPWNKLICRCYWCGAPLSKDEKLRHVLQKEQFLHVRGTFKGRCYECCLNGRRTCHEKDSEDPEAANGDA